MKKSYICLLFILIIGITSFTLPMFPACPLNEFLNWGLIVTILTLLIIAAFFFEFEGIATSSKMIALVSMLGTISAVLRIPFAALPSVQPCTFLIICSGYVFGPIAGFMVGAITPLVSNFFLGQGPWTPYQMLAWGLAGVSAAYVRRFHLNRIGLVIFGILWGYLYGWIIDVWFWSSFVYPLTLKTFIVAQLNSAWFDSLHAMGNAIFLGFFGEKTIAILERFKKRFSWDYQCPAEPL